MRRFPNGAKCRYQDRADGDEDGADEGVLGEPFTENQGSKYGVEDEARLF